MSRLHIDCGLWNVDRRSAGPPADSKCWQQAACHGLGPDIRRLRRNLQQARLSVSVLVSASESEPLLIELGLTRRAAPDPLSPRGVLREPLVQMGCSRD